MESGQKMLKEDGLGLPVSTMFLAGTMAGSGVLALSKAMVNTGPVEIFMLAFFTATSTYVGIRLGNCWNILEERFEEFRGHVRDPYPSIAEKAAGKYGRMLAVGCINLTLYGGGCVFLVLMATFVQNIFKDILEENNPTVCLWMVIVACCMIPLCMPGTPNDFWWLAVGALATTIIACVLIMVRIGIDAFDTEPDNCFSALYNYTGEYNGLVPEHKKPSVIGFFGAFSTTMFAFAGAPNFPTIQADMRDRTQFTKAAITAMIILFCIYTPMACVGYFLIGDAVASNIVQTMCDGNIKIAVEVLLLLHLVSAFPIVVNPCNQFLESVIGIPSNFTWKRVVFRSAAVAVLLFISETIPDFGSILDLVGGSTVTLLTFVFPPFFYMRLADMSAQNPAWKQLKVSTLERVYAWFVIIVGIVGGVSSTVVAIITIVDTNFQYPCYVVPFLDDEPSTTASMMSTTTTTASLL